MIKPDMTDSEKLFYYRKAAALYETMLDGKFGGFYDIPLLCDYAEIVAILERTGDRDCADSYKKLMIDIASRFIDESAQGDTSAFIFISETHSKNHTAPEKSLLTLLQRLMNQPEYETSKDRLREIVSMLKGLSNKDRKDC